jgi:hypothetical protein
MVSQVAVYIPEIKSLTPFQSLDHSSYQHLGCQHVRVDSTSPCILFPDVPLIARGPTPTPRPRYPSSPGQELIAQPCTSNRYSVLADRFSRHTTDACDFAERTAAFMIELELLHAGANARLGSDYSYSHSTAPPVRRGLTT